MAHFKFTHNEIAFIGLVNLHLDARREKPADGKTELEIIDNWFHAQATQKDAYMLAADEIIEARSKD